MIGQEIEVDGLPNHVAPRAERKRTQTQQEHCAVTELDHLTRDTSHAAHPNTQPPGGTPRPNAKSANRRRAGIAATIAPSIQGGAMLRLTAASFAICIVYV